MSNSILRKKTWTLNKDKFMFIVFLSSFLLSVDNERFLIPAY
ncbi:hypothetical protein BFO_3032 [Tannerella forsythia 92A2]|uniref:Uncharacterized protein n=1 Tax=Tannerella forsythia (strain ATCC 43037 / JCM 10827 / CCUG 21028 A / KCTC 5666 / FDC 338) TaxID=203275 RepID=G8UPV9_TANFA|nr:hypothetical protein BFO_3032 [Tannerella forsythia 92A2]